MLNIIRLTNNIFDDKNLSEANLQVFAEKHIVALTNDNPGGIYTTILSDVTLAYTAFFGSVSNEAYKKSVSEGNTINMNNALKAAMDRIIKTEGLVKYAFGENSSEYEAFFPLGLSEYHNAPLGEIGVLHTRFLQAANDFLFAQYPADVALIQQDFNLFKNMRDLQLSGLNQVETSGSGKREDKLKLAEQLTKNALFIAMNNINKPDVFDNYFDISLLPIERGNTTETFTGTVQPAEVVNIEVEEPITSPDTYITLTNRGTQPLLAGFAASATAVPAHDARTLNPGESIRLIAGSIGLSADRPFLNISNPSTETGLYRVKVE